MPSHFMEQFKKNFFVQFIFTFYLILTIWWIMMFARGLHDTVENNYFTLIYPFLSLFGGISGLYFSQKWGGFHSTLGQAIAMFSFGLLSQFFGQVMYAYYIYIQGIDVPYPSLGDVGFFGSVIFYAVGVTLLAKISGFRFSLRTLRTKLQSVLIPFFLLVFSYAFFLVGYDFDWSHPVKVFLDFGYPFGQAIYVSIAIVVFLTAKNTLGGIMKTPIVFLIFALVFQYFSDFVFLYQSNRGLWYVGGINDYMYCASYFLMTIALFYIGSMFHKIQES